MAMSDKLVKADLYFSIELLERLRYPMPRPLTVAEIVRVGEVIPKLRGIADGARQREERGELVFEWRIPSEWTAVKSGKGKPRWMLGFIQKKLEDAARKLLEVSPKADLCMAKRRRWVQVRRFSDQKPDRPRCPDCLGARQAIDVLTTLGVIVDDDTEWTVDDTQWIKCQRGQTHVIIRVFEVTTEGSKYWPEPACLPPPRPKQKRGPVVASIVGNETRRVSKRKATASARGRASK